MIVEDLDRVSFEIFPCCYKSKFSGFVASRLPCCVLTTTCFSYCLSTVNFLACKSALVSSHSSLLSILVFNCLGAGFCRLVLFYGYFSPFFILVANVLNDYSKRHNRRNHHNREWTGYYNNNYLLIGQKARNSGCDWFIQLSDIRCPITTFCYSVDTLRQMSD